MFTMRLVPAFLQRLVVWFIPAKWRLRRSTKELDAILIPEIQRRQSDQSRSINPDLLSWIVEGAKNDRESDPHVLAKLVPALNAGGTYS